MKAEMRNCLVGRSWVGEAGSQASRRPHNRAPGLRPRPGERQAAGREEAIGHHLGDPTKPDCGGGWCGKENSGTFQGLL